MVSVIIPVYNAEKHLERCLNSCLNQAYKELEIIAVNDGSCDKSGAILDRYAEMDCRIKVVHKSNGGVGSARNKGIELSTGEWCCFIDADDYVSPDYISKFLSSLCKDALFLMDRGYKVDYNSERTFYQGIPKDTTVCSTKDLLLAGELFYVINSPCMKLFSVRLIKENNIRFDEHLPFGEDHLFVLDYLLSLPNNRKTTLVEDDGYSYFKALGGESLTSKLPRYDLLYTYATEAFSKRKLIVEKYHLVDVTFSTFIRSECKKYLVFSLVSLLKRTDLSKAYKHTEFERISRECRKFYGVALPSRPYAILAYLIDYAPSILSIHLLPLCFDLLRCGSRLKQRFS